MGSPNPQADASRGVAHLLWRDTSIFQDRYEKSAAALIAVRDALVRQPSVCAGVAEFLEDYEALASADPDDFTAVWKDPYAYFWMRLAFELLGATLRGEPMPAPARPYATALGAGDARDALSRHLLEFKRLVLGLCVRDGRPRAFRTPLMLAPPTAIPGTRASLLGDGEVAILGCTGSHARLRSDGKELEVPLAPSAPREGRPAWLEACPVVESGELAIPLQPHIHNQYGLGLFGPGASRGFDELREHVPLMESALEILRRYAPDSFTQFGQLIRMIALQTRDAASYTNVSHSDLPGVMLVCLVRNAHFLADVFVHELHHNRLFFIEEIEPILDGTPADLESEARFVSPWRSDLRPLHGLLHGAYVFVPTTRYWLAVLAAGDLDAPTESMALHRAIGGLAQLRVGMHQLRRHGRFTSFGASFMRELEAEVEALAGEIDAAGLPDDTPFVRCHIDGSIEIAERPDGSGTLLAREQLVSHLRSFGPPDQVDDLLRHAIGAQAPGG